MKYICDRHDCDNEKRYGRKFCSNECRNKSADEKRISGIRGKAHDQDKWRQEFPESKHVATAIKFTGRGSVVSQGVKIIVDCHRCSSEMGPYKPSELRRKIKNTGGIYCSKKCLYDIRAPKFCDTCGGPITISHKKGDKYSRFCSKQCYSLWQKTPDNCGANHPSWTGGGSQDGRHTPEYRSWRNAVYERDQYQCQAPGCRVIGGQLNAHHVVPWVSSEDLRLVVDNGITLCELHHDWLHSLQSTQARLLKKIAMAHR